MKHMVKKIFLMSSLLVIGSINSTTGNTSFVKEKNGILALLKNGICPEGLEYSFAILSGGCAALPGIMADSSLRNSFYDVPQGITFGLRAFSGIFGSYVLYKTHAFARKRTKEALLDKKIDLEKKIKYLEKNGFLSKNTVITALNVHFTDKAEQGLSVLTSTYLKDLITQIEWLNPKLAFLGVPTISTRVIEILKEARAHIVNELKYNNDLKLNRTYQTAAYNNSLSTRIKRGTWWTTKKAATAGLFATKLATNVCWELFKIIFSNALRTIA